MAAVQPTKAVSNISKVDLPILVYQTGPAREAFKGDINTKTIIPENPIIEHQYLSHLQEAEGEAKDFVSKYYPGGKAIKIDGIDGIDLDTYTHIISIGSTSTQGWDKSGNVFIPDPNNDTGEFLLCGATVDDDKRANSITALAKKINQLNKLADSKVLLINAIGYTDFLNGKKILNLGDKMSVLTNMQLVDKFVKSLKGQLTEPNKVYIFNRTTKINELSFGGEWAAGISKQNPTNLVIDMGGKSVYPYLNGMKGEKITELKNVEPKDFVPSPNPYDLIKDLKQLQECIVNIKNRVSL